MNNESVPTEMEAMVLRAPGKPLSLQFIPVPVPKAGQVLIKVQACGICRTDLHIIDGELPVPHLPLIPGHEIVGTVAAVAYRERVTGEYYAGSGYNCRSADDICFLYAAGQPGRNAHPGFSYITV